MNTWKLAGIVPLLAAGICFSADKPAPAAAPDSSSKLWTSNFEAAKAQAAKEGKDILLDFTGSDWCGWCIKLKKEVFSTPEFEAAAPKLFVLVEADFPRDKSKVSAAVAAQNQKLQSQFGVQGYPTIFLLDPQGRPYGTTGYQEGGPTKYLAHLADLQQARVKRDAAWAKAEKATGVAKAKLLAEGLAALDEELVAASYGAVIAEIKVLDPQDASGIAKKSEFRAQLAELEKSVSEAGRKDGGEAAVVKQVDEFIAAHKPTGEDLQKAMMLKLNCYPPTSAASIDKAIALLDKVVAVDPTTPTGKNAEQIKPRAEMLKKRMKARKDNDTDNK